MKIIHDADLQGMVREKVLNSFLTKITQEYD